MSWRIVLNKRENFRKAFADYNLKKISNFGEKEISRLLKNAGIIRNRQKIEAAINNAKRFLEVQKEFGSFDKYIWQFTNYNTIQNKWGYEKEIPASTEESDLMSANLKKRGFKFVGSTICYAFMQAVGMVNDHLVDCFRYNRCKHDVH